MRTGCDATLDAGDAKLRRTFSEVGVDAERELMLAEVLPRLNPEAMAGPVAA